MVIVRCPACQSELSCDDSMLGNVIQCAVCQSNIELAVDGTALLAGSAVPQPAAMTPQMPSQMAPAEQNIPLPKNLFGKKSSLIDIIAISLSVIAIIVSISVGVFLGCRTSGLAKFSFESDPEKTVKKMFERDLKRKASSYTQSGYIYSHHSSEMLKEFYVDFEEKGDYALALWETRIGGRTFKGHYWLKMNKNGEYVSSYLSKYSSDITPSEKEWVERMSERISQHEKSNSDFEWDFKIK